MTKFWYIGEKGSFKGSRQTRIGSSEIAQLFPNPEKPTESIAGYDNTAITLYKKKIGEPEPFNGGLPAEMGHTHENKSLELFIRRFFSYEMGVRFRISKEQYENDLLLSKINKTKPPNAKDYQVSLFRHNTQYFIDGMIAHCDCIYIGDPSLVGKKERFVTVHGITVDLSKPFYIEAKSATKDATKRQPGSFVKGYDFDLLTWQGIPLKHFVQMQFQSSLLQIETGYLALLHNTSEFQVWRIDKDRMWQNRIIDIVGKILEYVRIKKMPRELAICQADIIELYPHLRNDFISLTGERLKKVLEVCKEWVKADQQEKNWKGKKKDAQDALSVYLKDYNEIRDGSTVLAKWQERKGGETLGVDADVRGKDSFLKWMKKEDKTGYKYNKRRGYIKEGKTSRTVAVKYKDG